MEKIFLTAAHTVPRFRFVANTPVLQLWMRSICAAPRPPVCPAAMSWGAQPQGSRGALPTTPRSAARRADRCHEGEATLFAQELAGDLDAPRRGASLRALSPHCLFRFPSLLLTRSAVFTSAQDSSPAFFFLFSLPSLSPVPPGQRYRSDPSQPLPARHHRTSGAPRADSALRRFLSPPPGPAAPSGQHERERRRFFSFDDFRPAIATATGPGRAVRGRGPACFPPGAAASSGPPRPPRHRQNGGAGPLLRPPPHPPFTPLQRRVRESSPKKTPVEMESNVPNFSVQNYQTARYHKTL